MKTKIGSEFKEIKQKFLQIRYLIIVICNIRVSIFYASTAECGKNRFSHYIILMYITSYLSYFERNISIVIMTRELLCSYSQCIDRYEACRMITTGPSYK